MRALRASGYWVAEWLPQIAMFDTTDTGTFAFFASCDLARFSSRRVIANHRSAGMSGALSRAMRQFVLHGLPTTRMRTSCAAFAAIAFPCGPPPCPPPPPPCPPPAPAPPPRPLPPPPSPPPPPPPPPSSLPPAPLSL